MLSSIIYSIHCATTGMFMLNNMKTATTKSSQRPVSHGPGGRTSYYCGVGLGWDIQGALLLGWMGYTLLKKCSLVFFFYPVISSVLKHFWVDQTRGCSHTVIFLMTIILLSFWWKKLCVITIFSVVEFVSLCRFCCHSLHFFGCYSCLAKH